MARVAVVLACCTAAAALAQDDVIVDWQDAAQCVERTCGVRGTVIATENDGPSIRLYFDAARQVRVLLMRGWLVTWPHYDGETIVATGKVDRFRDHVEVMVLDPSQVTVLSPTPSPTPSAASPSEVDELRRKVRELEERVRELEHR